MVKMLIFGCVDYSKSHFCDIWMIQSGKMGNQLPTTNQLPWEGFWLVRYAHDLHFQCTKVKKMVKLLIFACLELPKTLVMFEWFSMSNTMAKSISSIKICSIESIRCTKLKKMTKTLVFGHLDPSKGMFSDF